ncbi:uncharacterized protein DS421_9g271550 [Arachis hypogaea]|nr:uncharacterized protein DS421_9g271550 [Arachis hypogaea]
MLSFSNSYISKMSFLIVFRLGTLKVGCIDAYTSFIPTCSTKDKGYSYIHMALAIHHLV